jgi:hypothetical protein
LSFCELDQSFLDNPFLREELSKGFVEGAKNSLEAEKLVRSFKQHIAMRVQPGANNDSFAYRVELAREFRQAIDASTVDLREWTRQFPLESNGYER